MRAGQDEPVSGGGDRPSGPRSGTPETLRDDLRRFVPRSIWGILILLLLVAVVPRELVEVGHYSALLEERRANELNADLEVARSQADTFEAYVQDVVHQELALGLALTAFQPLSPGQAQQFLLKSAQEYPSVRHFLWVDPQGQVIASDDPAAVGLSISNTTYFRQVAVDQREWAISDLFQGPLTGEPTIAIARGIRNDQGVLQGVLVADIDPTRLGEVLRVQRAEQGTLVILDSQGRLVYIYPETRLTWDQRNKVEGQPLVNRALAGQDATGSFVSQIDGQTHLGAFAPIRTLGWVSRSSRPEAAVMNPVYRDLFSEEAQTLLIVALAFTAALLLGRYITKPANRLQRQAAALGRGEYGRRVEVTGPTEFKDLAASFNQMAEEVQTREQALRESEERYRTLAEAALDMIYILDREGKIQYTNSTGSRALGLLPEQLIGKRLEEIFPPEAAERLRGNVQKVFQTGEPGYFEEKLPLPGGEAWLGTRLAPLRNAVGEITAVLGISRNITESKRAEEERERLLQEVQRRAAELDTTINSIADGLIIYGPEGDILRLNEAAERLLGFTPGEREVPLSQRLAYRQARTAEGKPFPPEEHPVYRALHGEAVHGTIIFGQRPGGRPVWLSVSAAPIQAPDGRLLGAISIITDITPLHELQEQREDLLRSVSHDLRNPLTVILGQGQLLKRGLEKAGQTGPELHSAETIIASARRMNVMIQDLVDTARLESGQLRLEKRSVNLKSFVADLLERNKEILAVGRIKTDLPADLPPVSADPNRLERIFINLLTNALKYSLPETEVLVKAEKTAGEVTVSIADHGMGIAPEDLAHLFERYYRAKGTAQAEGLGLGLYITKMLVEAHGGRVWAESRVLTQRVPRRGKGSTFYFTLPLA